MKHIIRTVVIISCLLIVFIVQTRGQDITYIENFSSGIPISWSQDVGGVGDSIWHSSTNGIRNHVPEQGSQYVMLYNPFPQNRINLVILSISYINLPDTQLYSWFVQLG